VCFCCLQYYNCRKKKQMYEFFRKLFYSVFQQNNITINKQVQKERNQLSEIIYDLQPATTRAPTNTPSTLLPTFYQCYTLVFAVSFVAQIFTHLTSTLLYWQLFYPTCNCLYIIMTDLYQRLCYFHYSVYINYMQLANNINTPTFMFLTTM